MKEKGKLIESPIIGEDFTGYSVHSNESGWLISLTDFMTDWIRRYGVTPKPPKRGGFVTEKAESPRQPSAAELELAKSLDIVYCADLAEEGTPWEVPAESEPEYFATLQEATTFLVNLLKKECDKLEAELAEVSQHPVPAPKTSHRTWTEVKAEMDSKGEHPVPAPEQLAQRFHETYERLAPNFGYRLREGFDVPWADVPENNRQLMTAVCAEILEGEHPEPVPFNAEKSLRNMFESLKAGHPKPAKEVTMAERECAREVIAFILAVLQNCEIADAAEAEVAAIIRKHAAANVKGLTDTAEKLLEWMPIYSKGSSGNIRQTNLRAAIEKFKVEHPGPAKGGTE